MKVWRQILGSRNVIFGTLILVACLAATYALLFRDRALYNRTTPAEGRYWTAAQYLRAVSKVRQYAYERGVAKAGEDRKYKEALTRRWLNNMHTAAEVLLNANELIEHFESVAEYHEAIPLVAGLDKDLDGLVEGSTSGGAALLDLRERFDEVDSVVGRLAIKLRVLDQDDLTVSLKALQRGVQMQFAGGALAVLAMWFVVVGARSAARNARESERRTLAALEASRQAGQEIQHTLQTRTALLGMVSHELRTPLSKALAATELIELIAQGDGVKDAAEELYSAIETMTLQLSDLAAYAELSSPRSKAKTAELDVRSSLKEIYRTHQAQASENRVSVLIDVAPEVPNTLQVDAIRFGQIANNLIENAIKYTTEGTVCVGARIVAEANQLELAIRDSGPGIAPSDIARVWEPFYRAGTRNVPGSGLGLAVVKLAISEVAGTVALTSVVGKGSTFIVKIPL
jgi:signal transduction histidine kinase